MREALSTGSKQPGRPSLPSLLLGLHTPSRFLFRFGIEQGQAPDTLAVMQILYRAPDGSCFLSEEDCLSYEAEKPQAYWDRVNALQAFKSARVALQEREEKQEPGLF